jgi:hypothetical protein
MSEPNSTAALDTGLEAAQRLCQDHAWLRLLPWLGQLFPAQRVTPADLLGWLNEAEPHVAVQAQVLLHAMRGSPWRAYREAGDSRYSLRIQLVKPNRVLEWQLRLRPNEPGRIYGLVTIQPGG